MRFKSFFIIIGMVLLFFSPLIIFDLRHNFFNLEGVKILLTSKDPPPPFKERLTQVLLFISQNFLSIFTKNFYFRMAKAVVPFWLQILVIGFLLFFPFWLFLKSKKIAKKIIFLSFFLLISLGFLCTALIVNKFYRVNFYLFHLQPVFLLLIARIFVLWFRNRALEIIGVLFLAGFLLINLKDAFTFQREVNFKNQCQAVNDILENSKDKVEVYFPKFPDDSYRYLFYYLGRQKGFDYKRMVFYQPWQPVNQAKFVLHHQEPEWSLRYKRFGGIIVEERGLDED